MKKVESKIYPDNIWIRKTETGIACLRLRDNIEEITRDEDGNIETLYQYDEIEVEIANRPNLTDYVNANFNDLFNLGIEQQEQRKNQLTDKERIDELELLMADMVAEKLEVE